MRQTPRDVSPKSNAARNAYVVQRITKELLTMLKSQPLGAISVSSLCEKAGVGRASFYRNFASKEDVVKLLVSHLFREWMEGGALEEETPLPEVIRIMFAHFEKHRVLYQLLDKRGLTYLLKDVIIEICGPKPEQTNIEAYATAFVSYSLYGWVEVWFQRGMRESADEMAALFAGQSLDS